MSTVIEPRTEIDNSVQIQQEAIEASSIILAGLQVDNAAGQFIRDKVIQAYLLGRMGQAAANLDAMVKTMRGQSKRG